MSTNGVLTEEMRTIKTRQKATWESGDFGRVARYIEPLAEEFMARLPLRPGLRVLDVACGTGNLAVIAARAGCRVSGVDIAANLIAQARERAANERLDIDYHEGDAEALPFPDQTFDAVVTMYGAMFAPRPAVVAAELLRVTRPGGLIAMANWTPQGFIGKMFEVFSRHLPPPPAGVPSPLQWGDEPTLKARFGTGVRELRLKRQVARMRYPFPPAETVEFFRQYYGPTQRAFAALPPQKAALLRADLEQLQAAHNVSTSPLETVTPSEYLEAQAIRAE